MAFLVCLTVAAVGYCILPEQIAVLYHRFGESRCLESSDAFLCRFVAVSFLLFLVCFVNHLGIVPRRNRKQKANTFVKYWHREENVDLGKKILDLWMNFIYSVPMLIAAAGLLRFMLEHTSSSPVQGNIISADIYGNLYGDFTMITIGIWLLLILVLYHRTLAIVKHHRERNAEWQDKEPQV